MATFSMHSFITNLLQSREGELFKHPRRGYAGRVGNQILYFQNCSASEARERLNSELAIAKSQAWTNALLAHRALSAQ